MKIPSVKILLILTIILLIGVLATWYWFIAGMHLRFDSQVFNNVGSPIAGLLAFVGLAITIYLQIKSSVEQTKQERFRIYAKMLDDVRENLHTTEMGTWKGILLWHYITTKVPDQLPDSFNPYLNLFYNANLIVTDVMHKMKINKDGFSKEDVQFLRLKAVYVYQAYLTTLNWKVINSEPKEIKAAYKSVQTSGKRLLDLFIKYFAEQSKKDSAKV